MMKREGMILMGIMMLLSTSLYAQLKGNGLKTAIIQFNYIVDEQTMELVEYVDDFGALQCFKYDYMGAPFGTIVTNDSVYEVSYNMQLYKVFPRPEEDINFNALTPELIKKYHIESSGTVDFLDRKCTAYVAEFENRDVKKITVWVYKGIELRRVTEYKDGAVTDLVAISIEENAELSPDTFKIPAGFQLLND